jgi:hypothetical protein
MVLKILYFASLRETLGQGSEQLDLPPGGDGCRQPAVFSGSAW